MNKKTGALRGATGTDLASLTSILRDRNHRYGDKLINRDIVDIVDILAFIADGRIDMALYFEPDKARSLGDATREVMLYETICANCHGADGHLIASMESLGDFARDHFQETLHKMFNGHPAERMPPFRFIDARRVGDLFAYIRILPAKNLAASIVRGGRLYDHWLKETGGEAPTYRHPAYPKEMPQATSPITNWRCKECHGWDYMGRDGQYGKGPHRTGIKGIRALAGGDPQSVVYLLTDANHRYLSTRWSTGPSNIKI
jgi:hypothetical protein